MDRPTNQFDIPKDMWQEFVKNFDKLNRRAKKIGCEPVTFQVISEGLVEQMRPTYIEGKGQVWMTFKVPAKTIQIFGKAPKVEGFEFLARVEHLEEGKSLFHTVPGTSAKVDERFRDLTTAVCEHCNKARRRNDVYIVRDVNTGEQKQVGRQCLADYTGTNTPEKIAAKASWFSEFEKMQSDVDGMWSKFFEDTIDVRDALELTKIYIGLYGWQPRSTAGDQHTPTSSYVADHFSLYPLNQYEREQVKRANGLRTDATKQFADDVIKWVKDELEPKEGKNDYEMNLTTLVLCDVAKRKHLGIVCSAVAAYERAMNRKMDYANKRNADANSEHVGTIGERIRNVLVKVEFVRHMANDFGGTTLIKFRTAEGNLLTWFASGDRDFSVGEQLTLTGTIKKHDVYNGVKQTLVNRCAFN